jgi:hypothetical protein
VGGSAARRWWRAPDSDAAGRAGQLGQTQGGHRRKRRWPPRGRRCGRYGDDPNAIGYDRTGAGESLPLALTGADGATVMQVGGGWRWRAERGARGWLAWADAAGQVVAQGTRR